MEKIKAVYRIPTKILKRTPKTENVIENELFQHIGILMKKENIIEMVKEEGSIPDQTEFELSCVVMSIKEWQDLISKIRKAITTTDNGVILKILEELNLSFLCTRID